MKYIISEEVKKDLEKIWLYTYHNRSASQAKSYTNLIIQQIEFISRNPTSGKKFNHLIKRYFRSKIKSHYIFYKIDETKIQIIRILHERMDIISQLRGN